MDEYPEIKWDAPVINYLPDFKMYDPWVTKNLQVREIMSHHSGFNSYALDDLPPWGYDRDDLYKIYSVLQPTYSFRTKYAYNNSMYTIAAKIIEKYTGKSWDEAIVERIFTPLEMKNSTTGNISFYTAENLAQGYRMRKAEDKDEIVVVNTMEMTGAEIAALHAGVNIKIGFAGNVAHVFSKETGINLEA